MWSEVYLVFFYVIEVVMGWLVMMGKCCSFLFGVL